MKEDVFENPVEFRTAVPTPHFEDRRVVQQAQRVVPLNAIRAQQRKRKLWFLSGAFTIAMMLGAASALLAVHLKQRALANQGANQVTQVTVERAPENTAPEAQTAAALPAESTTDVPVIEEPVAEETPPPVKRVVTPKREQQPAVAERPRTVGSRRGEVEPSEDEQLEQIREAVLYDQWQERRMRRAARRERRNRGDRDLSHVDEIFEGPRRPQRP